MPIHSDDGREFENKDMEELCEHEGIKHQYSAAINSQ